MITQLMALPKGSGSAKIRAELKTLIEEEGLREYARVYTDGSVMFERSGCAIVMGHRSHKITRRLRVDKRVIMTDSHCGPRRDFH
jgi:hypothetical protein